MEKRKPGRPRTNKPTRNKAITIRLTENEYKRLCDYCYDNRVAYIDVLLKGLET